jgi:hypothetical protein
MTVQPYFVAIFREDGGIEDVIWYKALEEAKDAAKLGRKLFPKLEIIVGQRLE